MVVSYNVNSRFMIKFSELSVSKLLIATLHETCFSMAFIQGSTLPSLRSLLEISMLYLIGLEIGVAQTPPPCLEIVLPH